VPTDRCSRCILCNQDLLKITEGVSSRRDHFAKGFEQESRDGIGRQSTFQREVVTPPEGNDSPPAFEPMELEFFERQLAEFRDKGQFVCLGDRFRTVVQALR